MAPLGRAAQAFNRLCGMVVDESRDAEPVVRLIGLVARLEQRGRAAWPVKTHRSQRNRAIRQLRQRGVDVMWPEDSRDGPSGTAWCRVSGRWVS
jgi:hypothetical protein